MLMDDANALADKLRDSDEYKTYCETKARAYENPSTAALLNEFFSLRKQLQGARRTSRPAFPRRSYDRFLYDPFQASFGRL